MLYEVITMKTFAGGSIMGRRFEVTPKELLDEDIPDVVRLTGLSRHLEPRVDTRRRLHRNNFV